MKHLCCACNWLCWHLKSQRRAEVSRQSCRARPSVGRLALFLPVHTEAHHMCIHIRDAHIALLWTEGWYCGCTLRLDAASGSLWTSLWGFALISLYLSYCVRLFIPHSLPMYQSVFSKATHTMMKVVKTELLSFSALLTNPPRCTAVPDRRCPRRAAPFWKICSSVLTPVIHDFPSVAQEVTCHPVHRLTLAQWATLLLV